MSEEFRASVEEQLWDGICELINASTIMVELVRKYGYNERDRKQINDAFVSLKMAREIFRNAQRSS